MDDPGRGLGVALAAAVRHEGSSEKENRKRRRREKHSIKQSLSIRECVLREIYLNELICCCTVRDMSLPTPEKFALLEIKIKT